MKPGYLYIFGGEKAQGAETVIERLMCANAVHANNHLIISPGEFADKLINANKTYRITQLPQLRKLNRSKGGRLGYYAKAFANHFAISGSVHKYVKEFNIQLIHVNTIVPASYLLPLVIYYKLLNKSVTWIWSDHDLQSFSRIEHKLSSICAKQYDLTLAVSEAVKRKYGPIDKVKVLYNGLDTEQFKPDANEGKQFRKTHNIPDSTLVLGMPAVVHPRKGQLLLLSTFNKVSERHPDCLLLLAGRYESATPEYTALVKDLIKKNKKVVHLGYVNDITPFYNGCDIIINNSDVAGSEPLGTTLYEAMACEKIVIASATGGTPEIITDKVDGFLFPPMDMDGLTEILNQVMGHYKELGAVRRNAREKVIQRFGLKQMARRYNDLINEI